jgi:hypothetical protein
MAKRKQNGVKKQRLTVAERVAQAKTLAHGTEQEAQKAAAERKSGPRRIWKVALGGKTVFVLGSNAHLAAGSAAAFLGAEVAPVGRNGGIVARAAKLTDEQKRELLESLKRQLGES